MQLNDKVQHVYLVGAKSLGAYGGYETFVYKLTEYHQNKENIKYHVACKANGDGCMDESKFEGVTKINDHEFELHNAHCFKIDVPQIGPAQAIYYDVAALKTCCEHIKKNHIPHPIVYIMACRIGPFAAHFYKEIHKLGGTVYLNPDGHEWMRARWSAPIRRYWKISEQMMVKYCDLAICDSVNIEKYIHECYDGKGIKGKNPKTTFIAYGADRCRSYEYQIQHGFMITADNYGTGYSGTATRGMGAEAIRKKMERINPDKFKISAIAQNLVGTPLAVVYSESEM